MEISLIGLSVAAAIWLFARMLGSPLLIALIVSVGFGSTSAVRLNAVGGSSPLLYLVFEIILVGWVLFDRHQLAAIVEFLSRDWVSWVVGALIIYSGVGAFIMPRLFAGATNAFVAGRFSSIVEVALTPTPGNISQTGYFILGALVFFALSGRLSRGELLTSLRNGFLALAALNAISGFVDLGAKMAGAGDVFMPIRTATYAFLTEVEQAGFWRINGLFSEASGFGGATLTSLAFTFTYWAHSGSRRALVLAASLFVLLVLSTSSAAYGGLAVVMLPLAVTLTVSGLRGRVDRTGIAVLVCLVVGITAIIVVYLANPKLLEPFQNLFQTTVLEKSESESGRERAYWNERSLQSVVETFGLGIGYGSSRSSNWLIAVVSQLGVVGAALQFALLIPFLRRPQRPRQPGAAQDAFVLHRSLCSCVFAMLVSATIAGGAADPGLLFFVALAGVQACQAKLSTAVSTVTGSDRHLPGSTMPASADRLRPAHWSPAE